MSATPGGYGDTCVVCGSMEREISRLAKVIAAKVERGRDVIDDTTKVRELRTAVNACKAGGHLQAHRATHSGGEQKKHHLATRGPR